MLFHPTGKCSERKKNQTSSCIFDTGCRYFKTSNRFLFVVCIAKCDICVQTVHKSECDMNAGRNHCLHRKSWHQNIWLIFFLHRIRSGWLRFSKNDEVSRQIQVKYTYEFHVTYEFVREIAWFGMISMKSQSGNKNVFIIWQSQNVSLSLKMKSITEPSFANVNMFENKMKWKAWHRQ